jgi:hypothetical protein
MARLTWDNTGERLYETGVDRGVLYIPDGNGVYNDGVAWNGLTTVTESPSGAEATALYADNIKYLDLRSAEEFGATIEAFTFPDEFLQFDGVATPQVGVHVGQQSRSTFAFSYRTNLGNDVDGSDYGYKLHLIYGATAAPSEKAYATINDSPEAITFSWEIATTPITAGGALKPTAQLIIDSTKVDAGDLTTLEDLLYGEAGNPQLPSPASVIAIFGAGVTTVDMGLFGNQPSYVSGTHIITIPTVTGVAWKLNGVDATPGAQTALGVGETGEVTAQATTTAYVLVGDTDWVFSY